MTRTKMTIKTFNNEKNFIAANLEFLEGAKTIALSGGSTPKSTYLAMQNFPAEFYQVDERYVPADHPDSNQKMIAETLKQPLHHFDTSLPIKQSLTKYEDEIANIIFDVCILGIGPDGHTASLFPNDQALGTTRSVAHTQTTEFAIKDRLTITFPKILQSKKILVLLKNKQEILEKLQDSNANLPASELRKGELVEIHHLQLTD